MLEFAASRTECEGDEGGVDGGEDERAEVEVRPVDTCSDDALTNEWRPECTESWFKRGLSGGGQRGRGVGSYPTTRTYTQAPV